MPPKKTNLKKARGASEPEPKGQRPVVVEDDEFKSDDWEKSSEEPVSVFYFFAFYI